MAPHRAKLNNGATENSIRLSCDTAEAAAIKGNTSNDPLKTKFRTLLDKVSEHSVR